MKDDAISRQAAIDALSHMCSEDEKGITVSRANVDSMLKSLLPAQPEQKKGRWLSVKLLDDEADFEEVDGAECSMCGGTFSSEYWAKTYFKYCPYCGAYMMAEVSE